MAVDLKEYEMLKLELSLMKQAYEELQRKQLRGFGAINFQARKNKTNKELSFATHKVTLFRLENCTDKVGYDPKTHIYKNEEGENDIITELVIKTTFDQSVFASKVMELVKSSLCGEYLYISDASAFTFFNKDVGTRHEFLYVDPDTSCWCVVFRNILVKNADTFLRKVNKGVFDKMSGAL